MPDAPDPATPHPNGDHTSAHHDAIARIPSGVFVMTAAYDGKRTGLRVHLVQRAADFPPSVSVALQKGHPISPLVRDARAFGLCLVAEDDHFLGRRFIDADFNEDDDPFDAIEVVTRETGSPLISRAMAWLDCSVSMHIDFDSDHEIYIAEVVDSAVNHPQAIPGVRALGLTH